MYNIDYSIERDLYEASQLINNLEHSLHMVGSLSHRTNEGGPHAHGQAEHLRVGRAIAKMRRLAALRAEMSERQQVELGNLSTIFDLTRFYNQKRYYESVEQEMCLRSQLLREKLKRSLASEKGSLAELEICLMERTILQETWQLLESANELSDETRHLTRQIDDMLRRLMPRQADFRWVPALRVVYPSDRYWWLHRDVAPEQVAQH